MGATEGGSSGSPVLNASGQVVGRLSGACGTTDSSGVAVVESGKHRNVSNFQFCVDSISGSGISYDSSADAESCDSF